MTDVAIAGGGIAGSTLAILLGRAGLSVELFERGEFPKEKACGEGLMPGGVAVVERLGLAETALGQPFQGVRYHFGEVVAEGCFPRVSNLPATGYAQRRKYLDQRLFQAAASTPGVIARSGARVSAPLLEHGRVTGVVVDGEPHRAALTIAADGAHSPIRRALSLDAPARRKRFGMRAHFRLAPGQPQRDWVDVFAGDGYELYVTPLPNREFGIAALADAPAPDTPQRTFMRWALAQAALAARLEGAQQLTELLGAAPLERRARAGVAPGLVLLGDAAGSTDPITGGGMAQALMTAELLAHHIALRAGHGALTTPDDVWFRQIDRERRAMLRNYRAVTRMTLWLADHRRLAHAAVFSLRLMPALFSNLLGVCGGVSPLQKRLS